MARSFMRSVSPRIKINEQVAKEKKLREKARIKKVMADRKKVADRLKSQGYTCKIEKININKK